MRNLADHCTGAGIARHDGRLASFSAEKCKIPELQIQICAGFDPSVTGNTSLIEDGPDLGIEIHVLPATAGKNNQNQKVDEGVAHGKESGRAQG